MKLHWIYPCRDPAHQHHHTVHVTPDKGKAGRATRQGLSQTVAIFFAMPLIVALLPCCQVAAYMTGSHLEGLRGKGVERHLKVEVGGLGNSALVHYTSVRLPYSRREQRCMTQKRMSLVDYGVCSPKTATTPSAVINLWPCWERPLLTSICLPYSRCEQRCMA